MNLYNPNPTYSGGYAHDKSESMFPGQWDGLVAGYGMFLGPNGELEDHSGNGNHGVKTAGVSQVADYLNFAGGASSNIDLGSSDLFEITASRPFSLVIECRFSTGTERNIIGKNEGGLVNWWNLGTNIGGLGAGRITWEADDNATKRQIESTIAINDNLWHQLVIARTPGTGYEMFIDGISDGTAVDTGDCSNNEKCFIGSQDTRTAGVDFLGDIRQVSIYHRTLLASEVLARHRNPEGWAIRKPSVIPLVAAAPAVTFVPQVIMI